MAKVTVYPAIVKSGIATGNAGAHVRAVPPYFRDAVDERAAATDPTRVDAKTLEKAFETEFPKKISSGTCILGEPSGPPVLQIQTRQNAKGEYRTEIQISDDPCHIRQFGSAVEAEFNKQAKRSLVSSTKKATALARFMVENLPEEYQPLMADYKDTFITQVAPGKDSLACAFTRQKDGRRREIQFGKYRNNSKRDASTTYSVFIDHDEPLQWHLPLVEEGLLQGATLTEEQKSQSRALAEHLREKIAPIHTLCWMGNGEVADTPPMQLDLSRWVDIAQSKQHFTVTEEKQTETANVGFVKPAVLLLTAGYAAFAGDNKQPEGSSWFKRNYKTFLKVLAGLEALDIVQAMIRGEEPWTWRAAKSLAGSLRGNSK